MTFKIYNKNTLKINDKKNIINDATDNNNVNIINFQSVLLYYTLNSWEKNIVKIKKSILKYKINKIELNSKNKNY